MLQTNRRHHAPRSGRLAAQATIAAIGLALFGAPAHAGVSDTTPPYVFGSNPLNNAENVRRDIVIRVNYNEALDPASISSASLTLVCGGNVIAGTVSYNDSSNPQLVFTPAGLLPVWSPCTVTIPAGAVRDIAQNPSARSVSRSFRTVNLYRALNVVRNGLGSGRVYGASVLPASTPNYGVDCGSDCTASVGLTESYMLNAVPARGSRFVKWINCPQVSGSYCTITNMSAAITVTAQFSANGAADLEAPAHWPTAGWQEATPESQGFAPGSLVALAAEADAALPYHTSLLVVKNGQIVHESYHEPAGSATTIDASTKHHIWSVTKSVTALTFGTALRSGDVTSADFAITAGDAFAPLLADLPVNARQRNITLYDTLRMRSGLKWNDAYLMSFTESPMFVPDPACADDSEVMLCSILHREPTYAPGTVWNYSTMDSYLAASFFRHITGTPLHEYAASHLFAPLGIDYTEGDWYTWPVLSSNTFGGGLLYMKTRDLGKVGMLALYDGLWDGTRLINTASLATAFTSQGNGLVASYDSNGQPLPVAQLSNADIPYGMHWWLNNSIGQTPDGTLSARGLGGQLIHIFPDKELVVVVTCDDAELTNRFPAIHAFVQAAIVDRLAD